MNKKFHSLTVPKGEEEMTKVIDRFVSEINEFIDE